jgi:hypothetical protein
MMKRPRIRSFDELLQATGKAWEEMPQGFSLAVTDDSVEVSHDRLIIALPKRVAEEFQPRASERFVARVSAGRLIVERRRGPRRKRPSRG